MQTVVLDGYNAPVSAGQFMDLVNKKFYDNMEIQRADGFVVQYGDPPGPEDGYKDPKTNEIRRCGLRLLQGGAVCVCVGGGGRKGEGPVAPASAPRHVPKPRRSKPAPLSVCPSVPCPCPCPLPLPCACPQGAV